MGNVSCEHQQFLSSWAVIYIGTNQERKCNESHNTQCSKNASWPHSSWCCLEKQKATLPGAVIYPLYFEGMI